MKKRKLKVFIAGQKYFGAEVLKMCLAEGIEVTGVLAPDSDTRLSTEAERQGIKVVTPGLLDFSLMEAADLGICAHYFGMIPTKALLAPSIGWIGYHPSLLPLHKGRSSIEWAIRMRESVTGGTIYWLNTGFDSGDILCQEHCFINPELFGLEPKESAAILWREQLAPLGLSLFKKSLNSIQKGEIIRQKQDRRFATAEPFIK